MSDQQQATASDGAEDTKQIHIVAWCMPRCLSTTMLRAMHNKTGCASIMEPYARAYYLGEERQSVRFVDKMPPIPNFKYTDIKKEIYEGKFRSKQIIFAKDMAYYVMTAVNAGLYKLEDLIPAGYRHVFMVRKPEKAIKSMYNMFALQTVPGWDHWSAEEAGFKELYEIYKFVTENIDPNPLVIEADDLITCPEKVLRHFCERVGIEFEDSMINWKANDGLAEKLEAAAGPFLPFWETTLTADTFVSNTPAAARTAGTELPEEVIKCIEENKVWYEKLAAHATRFN